MDGTFAGEIEAAGDTLKTETRFNFENGAVEGTYSFNYEGELVQGTLLSADATQPRSISFTWRDKFGTGTLTTEFNDDCSEFKGKWALEGKQQSKSWNGKRR